MELDSRYQYRLTKEWITKFEDLLAIYNEMPFDKNFYPDLRKVLKDMVLDQLIDFHDQAKQYEEEHGLSTRN